MNRVLEAIAASNDPNIREVTTVNYYGRSAPLRLEEKSVVPSHLWVDRHLLQAFRKHLGMSSSQLGRLLFGSAEYADFIIHRLENGEMHRTRAIGRQSGDSDRAPRRSYDYRVTQFTADSMYRGLRAIFEGLSQLHGGQFQAVPAQSKFFIASHTSGEGSGRRTQALPIPNGNSMSPMTERDSRHAPAHPRTRCAPRSPLIDRVAAVTATS